MKILGTEDVSSQVVEETWQNIKAKLKVTKLFNYALVSMIFFSFILMLLGQKSGFLEAEKHFQEPFNPLGTVTRNVDIANPKMFPLAEKTVVNQIKEQELQLQLQTLNKHKATINNTAYVNGQPTNTVSIAYEENLPNIGATSKSDAFSNKGIWKAEGSTLGALSLILLGLGSVISKNKKDINKINTRNKTHKLRERIRRSMGMKKRIKRKAFTLILTLLMSLSMVSTLFPVGATALPTNGEQATEQTTPVEEKQLPNEELIAFCEWGDVV